jgi:hypothetical protein
MGDRRSWSGLRSRSAVAVKVQAKATGVAERGMRALLVVARAPTRQSISGVFEIVEDRLIEQFIAHSPIERFADPVLHRLARRDEMPGDPALLRPGGHCVRGELGSMVGDDQVRPAAPGDDGVGAGRRQSCHSIPVDRAIAHAGEGDPSKLVYYRHSSHLERIGFHGLRCRHVFGLT